MNYTVSLLTSKPDCQALIDIANAAKESLSYRKTGLARQRQTSSVTSMEIAADLAATISEIALLQGMLNDLPEGTIKDETLVRITKANYKKFLLEQRKANYGVISLVEKEYDLACADQSITETDAFIAALTARMNEVS